MQGIAYSVQPTVCPCQGPGAILSHLERLLEAIVKFALTASLIFALGFTFLAAATEEKSPKPQYDSKGNLLRPADYRDWMFLSAGYGMNYSPSPGSHEMFTNVFVQRWAYQEFLNSGKWPKETALVIDELDPESKGSINRTGTFQTDLMSRAAQTTHPIRHPDKWAYFG